MSVAWVEFLVEEPSMEVFLRALLPRLLGAAPFEIRTFQCKKDLLTRLPDRLRGYAWFPEDYRVVVIVDQDSDACQELKQKLEQHALDAGLPTRTHPQQGHFTIVNRIAIEELEAWYFGDWEAVRTAYPRVSQNVPRRARFRNPDAIAGGTWEAFERTLQRHGYFKEGLRKIEAARSIAQYLDPASNTSRSFQVLRDALLEFVNET